MSVIPKYYLSWISQRFNNILVIFYIVFNLQLKAIVLIMDYNSIEPLVLGSMTLCVCACLLNSLTFPLLVFSFVFNLYLTQFSPFVRGVGKCWLLVQVHMYWYQLALRMIWSLRLNTRARIFGIWCLGWGWDCVGPKQLIKPSWAKCLALGLSLYNILVCSSSTWALIKSGYSCLNFSLLLLSKL